MGGESLLGLAEQRVLFLELLPRSLLRLEPRAYSVRSVPSNTRGVAYCCAAYVSVTSLLVAEVSVTVRVGARVFGMAHEMVRGSGHGAWAAARWPFSL